MLFAHFAITCVDEACHVAFCKELSIVEAFMAAVDDDESILVDGEKATIEELDESTINTIIARLRMVANGESVPVDQYPVQDDRCHHPGCEYEHEYDDEHFHEHCELCQTWLHINMPINIVKHPEKGLDFSVCHECVTDDGYLQGGYIDDAGNLQCLRADSDAMLRMVDVAYKRAQIEGIESGQAFFENREHFKSKYETIMKAIATEWNMGDDDNFDFLKDHANDLLESLYTAKN
jgi:hypothetical protein